MGLKDIELEKLRDWFDEKYDWECYKEAEAEYYKTHKKRIFFSIPEEDRLWLIERTKEILQDKWDKRMTQSKEEAKEKTK